LTGNRSLKFWIPTPNKS